MEPRKTNPFGNAQSSQSDRTTNVFQFGVIASLLMNEGAGVAVENLPVSENGFQRRKGGGRGQSPQAPNTEDDKVLLQVLQHLSITLSLAVTFSSDDIQK